MLHVISMRDLQGRQPQFLQQQAGMSMPQRQD